MQWFLQGYIIETIFGGTVSGMHVCVVSLCAIIGQQLELSLRQYGFMYACVFACA